MAAKNTPVAEKDKWYEKPIAFGIAVLTLVTTCFAIGYSTGDFKKGLEQQVTTLQKEQECNERVQQEKEKCAEYRRTVETEKMQDLTKTIESLKAVKSASLK